MKHVWRIVYPLRSAQWESKEAHAFPNGELPALCGERFGVYEAVELGGFSKEKKKCPTCRRLMKLARKHA